MCVSGCILPSPFFALTWPRSPLLSSLFHIGNRISTSQKVLYLTFSTLHYNYHYNYNYNHNYKRTSRS